MKRAGSSPKLNVLNTGLMTALSGYSFEEATADRTFWGRVVESAVGAHLHNTLEPGMRLSYWRDDPDEVDFVVSRGPRVLGIEVKERSAGAFLERAGGVQEAVFAEPNPAHRGERRRSRERVPRAVGTWLA